MDQEEGASRCCLGVTVFLQIDIILNTLWKHVDSFIFRAIGLIERVECQNHVRKAFGFLTISCLWHTSECQWQDRKLEVWHLLPFSSWMYCIISSLSLSLIIFLSRLKALKIGPCALISRFLHLEQCLALSRCLIHSSWLFDLINK